ncbi:MAG: thiamine-phosphate kinase [Rhizobiales bacterium]|nr:thiamine-phosphate kinase [Hyphomicrobiales bacterium]
MPGSVVPGEFELIAEFFAPLAGGGAFGLEDDAASLAIPSGENLVITQDMLVEDVHFFGADAPGSIAKKALGVNLSDLAAKGARPLGFTLGFGRTSQQTRDWCRAFAEGLGAMAREAACPLLGGDTVNAPVLTLSITAFGAVPSGRMVPRQGGRPGDLVYVSGTIGDAALGLKMRLEPDAPWVQALDLGLRAHLADRYLHPRPRITLAPLLLAYASAAMDVSDGLVGDTDKLARKLGARFEIARVPLSEAARTAISTDAALLETALTGGDDYEILCSVPPDRACEFVAQASNVGVDVTKIGVLETASSPKIWKSAMGQEKRFTRRSYTHSL